MNSFIVNLCFLLLYLFPTYLLTASRWETSYVTVHHICLLICISVLNLTVYTQIQKHTESKQADISDSSNNVFSTFIFSIITQKRIKSKSSNSQRCKAAHFHEQTSVVKHKTWYCLSSTCCKGNAKLLTVRWLTVVNVRVETAWLTNVVKEPLGPVKRNLVTASLVGQCSFSDIMPSVPVYWSYTPTPYRPSRSLEACKMENGSRPLHAVKEE